MSPSIGSCTMKELVLGLSTDDTRLTTKARMSPCLGASESSARDWEWG